QRDPAFAKDVRAVLARMAGQGHVGQDEVASVMHMSVATLRRRLAEDGLQFRDLKQQALNSQARAMLAAGHPVGDVAETLGFAEPRSFNRAFKAWNDITPRQFQKKQS
ncbi:MAG: helix-turn-helix domain-containing protein, partial [Pseudomonadota bacterium]